MKPLAEQDHYEILEIPRDASPAAVDRAYRLARSSYADDSLALYSVVAPRDAEAIRERVEEAYRVLSDLPARTAYDEALEPASDAAGPGIRFDAEPVREDAAPRSPGGFGEPPPQTPPVGTFDGAAFRAARLRHSLDFEQIAGVTKVNPRYLRYIEEEHLEGLPARVYVRGFVEAFARAVGFDPDRAVSGYMQIFDQQAPAPVRRSRFLGRR